MFPGDWLLSKYKTLNSSMAMSTGTALKIAVGNSRAGQSRNSAGQKSSRNLYPLSPHQASVTIAIAMYD
jgi:hypothetical protein